MTTINDIADLIRILQEQPEWGEALRSVLLSRELLDLPEKFARFAESTNTNFQTVNARLDGMDQRFDGMDQRLDRMDGRMDNGFGTNYEIRVERNLPSHAGQRLGLRNVRILRGTVIGRDPTLAEQSEQAAEDGVISWTEHDDLWLSDLIFTGRSRTGGATLHALAEVSITAGNDDLSRAAERARILSIIIGEPVTPLVICANIDQERATRAQDLGVTLIQAPQ